MIRYNKITILFCITEGFCKEFEKQIPKFLMGNKPKHLPHIILSYLVKDSIQNLFIYLRKKRGSLSKINNIKGYLFKSIQREIIRNRRTNAFEEKLGDNLFGNHFLIEVSPEVSIIKGEVETELKAKVHSGKRGSFF